ncbi:hypothetical protein L218DRAFT_879069, partial [Marasmius fiardii PR-910]
MPLYTGLEANAVRSSARLAAETGRPETSREFAMRTKGFVRVRGPRRVQEGGSTQGTDQSMLKTSSSRLETSSSRGTRLTDVSENPETAAPVPNIDNAVPGDSNSFIDVVTAATGGLTIQSLIRNKYSDDTFFKKILESPKDYRNFLVTPDGLVFLKHSDSLKVLCIPRILVNQQSIQELIIAEAHSLLAHLGAYKTADYLKNYVWWK